MLAGACIGSNPEDAYLSARELRESLEWIHEGENEGKVKLTTILSTACDDFQRCLYYCVAGKGVVTMLDDLVWLEKLLEAPDVATDLGLRDRRVARIVQQSQELPGQHLFQYLDDTGAQREVTSGDPGYQIRSAAE